MIPPLVGHWCGTCDALSDLLHLLLAAVEAAEEAGLAEVALWSATAKDAVCDAIRRHLQESR